MELEWNLEVDRYCLPQNKINNIKKNIIGKRLNIANKNKLHVWKL